MEKWIRARYQPNLPLDGEHRVTASRSHIALSRQAAQEGAVLLKNDAELLPLAPGTRVALFGKGSLDYVKGGGGSGDVTVAYTRNLYDGLKGEGVPLYEPLSDFYRNYVAGRDQAGDVPGLMAEPELPQELVDAAREQAEVAVIVLSRFSGEGWDREPVLYQEPDYPWPDELEMPKRAMKIFPKGDFYLTDAEQNMVRQVRTAFAQVVLVLNVGGVMDVSWFWEDDRIPSVLLAYQGGMEGGAAIAALLTGKANPCGRLPDTFARDLSDYPSTAHFHDFPHYVEYTEDIYVGYRYFETLPGAGERVCYPFGFGLSYTTFALETVDAGGADGRINVSVRVTNTFGLGNLPEYGVPNLTTADGPAGLRVQPEVGICTTAWPCATLLAATWDCDLVSRVGAAAAAEVKENNISVWLAPAVNIHRNPLCGRNFEYFSEDPLLTGKLAGTMVEGIQSQHIAATVKHFACNNKETNRKYSDSRLSQRALREIYLRAFEIIVQEAQPWAIMSSYNVINGRRASESRDLLTDILRGDWGYTGMVMTDWWTRGGAVQGAPGGQRPENGQRLPGAGTGGHGAGGCQTP